jgi:excisionase family DNA binding protein
MTPRDLQFDLRKNPDSPRVHGLRTAVSTPSNAVQKEFQSADEKPPGNAARMNQTFELPLRHAPTGATGEREKVASRLLTIEEVAHLLHVPVSWVYGRMRKRSPERLPAYRLGKYWRFREDEIFVWIAHQKTNSEAPRHAR